MGRRRRHGARERNGRLQRESVLEVMEPALRRRCAVMGWRPNTDNLRRARDQRLETLAGRLAVAERITTDAYLGFVAFAIARERYLRAIGAPSPHPGAVDLGAGGFDPGGHLWALGGPEDAEDVNRRLRAYAAADGAVAAAGADLRAEVYATLGEPDDVAPGDVAAVRVRRIQAAGDVLARHFGCCGGSRG